MELGNRLFVSKQAIANHPGIILNMCLHNCLVACKQYGIEPIGSFEMETFDSPDDPRLAIVMYHFEGA